MHALGQVVRRVAAIITAIAVCGIFTCVRAERTGKVDVAQISAVKAPMDYAVILPEEFGKVSGGDTWSKPNTSTAVCGNFVVPRSVAHLTDEVLAVTLDERIAATVRLVGVVELRI